MSRFLLAFAVFEAGDLARPGRAADATQVAFQQQVRPLLEHYCFDCHGERKKADLDLRVYTDAAAVTRDRAVFERVLLALRGGEMPPQSRPQPTETERALLVDWLDASVFPVDCNHPDPGRVTLHRLNRAEYNNTVRDLVGIDFKPAEDFPADDAGYGFDNIGDVLSLPPVLLERYLDAAEQILDRALVEDVAAPLTESHRRIVFREPGADPDTAARAILQRFATRAYRRPATHLELDRLMELRASARQPGDRFVTSLRPPLLAILISPHFLFRGELQPAPNRPDAVHRIDEFALASRLSYFLWSSMPDDALQELARKGRLRRNLDAQVRRMLDDPKAHALVENFAGQWLQLRNLDLAQPDKTLFPGFDQGLRQAMRRETELFFELALREDWSLLEFLEADFTFVDDRLAAHYGLEAPGTGFRRVSLAGTGRGGVLTQGSVLTLTSNPTRTSPVKRGKWVLENILGTPPPPPPPNVPPLDNPAGGALQGTLRQRMEQHRSNPACAGCHARMDPIGFGLENFDATGAWRARDGGADIDATGRLVSGEAFAGADELRRILAGAKREEFLRCITAKLLTYALGRGLEYYDRCAVDEILARLRREDGRFSALIFGIVHSAPFQLRRGEGAAPST